MLCMLLDAARQRFVHTHHDGANFRRRFVARQHGVEPFHLIGIELLGVALSREMKSMLRSLQ